MRFAFYHCYRTPATELNSAAVFFSARYETDSARHIATASAKVSWEYSGNPVVKCYTFIKEFAQWIFRRACELMPVLTDLTISIEPENLLRRAGINNRSQDKELLQMMLFELNTEVETLRLLQPCILYEIHNVIGIRGSRVMLENGAYITSRFLSSLYPSLKAVAALICTIGHDLEDMMTTFYHRGEQLRAFLLDAIGSAAIDTLAAEACHIIEQAVSNRGLNAGSPLSPGMPGLSISEQSILFALAPAEAANVSLTPGGIMRPLKSLSMIIPAGEKMPVWGKEDMCRRCNLRKNCPSRYYSES